MDGVGMAKNKGCPTGCRSDFAFVLLAGRADRAGRARYGGLCWLIYGPFPEGLGLVLAYIRAIP